MRKTAQALLGAAMLCGFSSPALARLELVLPLDCTIGESCFIQNYFDHNRAEGAAHDYTCASLTYDGHHGTDFRVARVSALEAGIPVLAAQAGRVGHVQEQPVIRDSDIPMLKLIKTGMQTPCGTGLRIEHGAGWESLYCHLQPGSIKVAEGEEVKAGQAVALMGRSGESNFPHVHYELRHHNTPVDPFVGYANAYRCEDQKLYTLWKPEVAKALYYRAAGVVDGGFSSEKPPAEAVHSGEFSPSQPTADTISFYFWVSLYGVRPNDVLTLRFVAPNGQTVAEKREVYTEAYGLALETLPVARLQSGWQEGRYRAQLTLERFEDVLKETLVQQEWVLEL